MAATEVMMPLMKNNLHLLAQDRNNNFNLVRFIAATLVLVSHSFALATGTKESEPLYLTLGITWGSIAVDIFFVSSGFLITASFFARKDLLFFAWARFLRIFPGLIVAIIFCVFIIGATFTSLTLSDYLTNPKTWQYTIKNSSLLLGIEYRLPGVFENTPWPQSINGSLWTLPYELKMYFLIAALLIALHAVAQKVQAIKVAHGLLVVTFTANILNVLNVYYSFLPTLFTHLATMFVTGACYYVWRDKISLSTPVQVIALASLLIGYFFPSIFTPIYLLAIPFITLWFAYVPKGKILGFNKLGDYSYGIYIYAFPVQQSVMHLYPDASILQLTVLSFVVTVLLAALSWQFIEKQCLKQKDKYATLKNFIVRLVRKKPCAAPD